MRLSGSAAAVRAAATALGGRSTDAGFWSGVREHTDAFFTGEEPLLGALGFDHAAARAGRPSAHRMERRLTLAEVGNARKRGARSCAAQGHATLFRAADKQVACFRRWSRWWSACTGASRRPSIRGHLQPGSHARRTLGLGEVLLLCFHRLACLRAKGGVGIPREEACVQLDRKHRLAGLRPSTRLREEACAIPARSGRRRQRGDVALVAMPSSWPSRSRGPVHGLRSAMLAPLEPLTTPHAPAMSDNANQIRSFMQKV